MTKRDEGRRGGRDRAERAGGRADRASRRRVTLAAEGLEERSLLTVAIPQVDLVLGYTPLLLSQYGSRDQLLSQMRRSVADFDQILVNSNVNETVRLVDAREVSYSEVASGGADRPTGEMLDDLTAQSANGTITGRNGLQSFVTAARADGADAVMLLVGSRVGGMAYQGTSSGGVYRPYGVTALGAFSHELGHILGAGHHLNNTAQEANAATYAHGYNTTIDGFNLYTVMGGGSLPFFSNPDMTYRGVPVGTSAQISGAGGTGQANNARAMNDVASNARSPQNYTARTRPDATGPLAALGPVTAAPGGKLIDVEVIYYDDGGVNLGTLAGSTLKVSGPAGAPVGTATFQGISTKLAGNPSAVVPVADNTPNAATVIANYRLTLANPVGDLTAYTFALGGTAVQDQSGNSASALSAIASGSPSASPSLLPKFGGSASTFSAKTYRGDSPDLGDLSARSVRVSDYVGRFQAGGFPESISYQFTLSSKTTLSPVLTGPAGAQFNIASVGGGQVSRITATNGSYSLDAGTYLISVDQASTIGANGPVAGAAGPFTLLLSSPTPPAPAPGALAFSVATSSVASDAGSINLIVTRTGGTAGDVAVTYATSNGTAVAGTDYQTRTGSLKFAAGETQKTLTVPIVNNPAAASARAFTITLSSPSGGATLGSQVATTVTINPVNPPPTPGTLAFSTATVTADARSGQVILTVNRAGGTSGQVTATYTLTSGSAVAGTDYTGPTSGTLTIPAGAASGQVTIPLNLNTSTAARTFTVTLSSPGGGASLGSLTTTTVTIPPSAPPSTPPPGSPTLPGPGEPEKTLTLSGTRTVRYSDGTTRQLAVTRTVKVSFAFASPGQNFYKFAFTDVSKSDGSPAGSGSGTGPAEAFTVVAGPIRGSEIVQDLNGNGVADPDEPTGFTDASGHALVFLPPGVNTGRGSLLVTGGTDTSTRLPNQLRLSAPSDFAVITPLTTLIQAGMQQAGLARGEAMTRVERALRLDTTLDLAAFDPLAAAGQPDPAGGEYEGDPEALPAYKADVQISTLVMLVMGVDQGARVGGNTQARSQDVFARLGRLIATTDVDLDAALVDPRGVDGLLRSLAPEAVARLGSRRLAAVDRIIANTFTNLERPFSNAPGSPQGSLEDPSLFALLARDQAVAERQIERTLAGVASGRIAPGRAVRAFSTGAIAHKVAVSNAGSSLFPTVARSSTDKRR